MYLRRRRTDDMADVARTGAQLQSPARGMSRHQRGHVDLLVPELAGETHQRSNFLLHMPHSDRDLEALAVKRGASARRMGLAPAERERGEPGGPCRRYCTAILLHGASAVCLIEAIGMFAAAARQASFASLSAALTFVLLVVI